MGCDELSRGEFQGRRILQAASFEQLWHPYQQTGPDHPDEFAGLSWFIDSYRGQRRMRHDGVDTGFQTGMVLLPEQSLAVIHLANTIPAPVNAVMDTILDLLLGLEPEFPKPPVLVSLGTILAEQESRRPPRSIVVYRRHKPISMTSGRTNSGYCLHASGGTQIHRGYSGGATGNAVLPRSAELAELAEKINSRAGK